MRAREFLPVLHFSAPKTLPQPLYRRTNNAHVEPERDATEQIECVVCIIQANKRRLELIGKKILRTNALHQLQR